MPDINWGILSTPTQDIRTATPSAPSAPAVNPNSGMEGLAQMQQMQIERQKLGLLQNADAREQQLQPGKVAAQGLENAYKGVLTKQEQIKLTAAQREQTYQQNADKALMNTRKAGLGHEAQLDAYQEQLSPEAANAFQKDRDSHKEMVINNNAKGLENAAGTITAGMADYQRAKTPEDKAAVIANINKQLDRIDPDHSPITDEKSLHNYSIASIGTLMNPKVQAQYKMEMQKIEIAANAKSTADISTDAIKNANADAAKANKLASDATAAMNADNAIKQWNIAHPDKPINIGPGFTGWKAARQMVAAAGGPVEALDQMEQYQATTDQQITDTLTSLKTMPRSAPIVSALTASLASPTDTAGARQAKYNAAIYASKYKSSYADFIGDYKDANGSITGVQNAWGNFVNNDPNLIQGKGPNPAYLSTDNYKPYLDRNYRPAPQKAPVAQVSQQQTSNQVQQPQQPITKTLGNITYVQQNGKWYAQ